jgi:amidase
MDFARVRPDTRAMSFADWDAVETAERIRKREVSVREVTDAAIVRAEGASKLGAIVTPTFDVARGETPSGPLAGVPTFIKDLAQVGGVRVTWGSAATGMFISKRTDPSLLRLLATGLVSLGKSATPEFGFTATTEPLGRPPCRNPWDPSRSAGGSSGGAACLVAAGVVPIAHATDGAGSIRIPAACTGLVGLKPTRGRFDVDGAGTLLVNISVQGVVSRTVRDTAAFFSALESRGSPIAPIGDLRIRSDQRLRIGLFVDAPTKTRVDPEQRAAAESAAKLCEALGHHVALIPCPFEAQVTEDFFRFWSSLAFVVVHAGALLTHRGFDAARLEPWTRGMSGHFSGKLLSSLSAVHRLRRFTATYAAVMQRFDVLICPTLGEAPPPLGHLRTDLPFETAFERLVRFIPFTPIQNAAGAPAITLPLGRSADGLPIGVQFAAARGDERTLLELSLALEAAQPWERVAPVERWRGGSWEQTPGSAAPGSS